MHISHHVFRHPNEPVAGVDRTIRADGKRAPHAIHERAHRPVTGEHALAQVADIHDLHLPEVLKGEIQKIHQQFPVLVR
ncbi:MAG: hypothetical protein A4E38_00163 [Methanoregulaceae archaeon PtaB.Bin108]|nr:MAG: hypothetical protein A4E38_00163 [Methanoregulaceae archaeon PtaB.Bin108]